MPKRGDESLMKQRHDLDIRWLPRNDYQGFSRQFVFRLSRALRKESWGRTVVQLAWTAGPVTYLALNAGYYIGFGVPAPPQLFVYFAAYTLVAGLFAVMMRIGYDALRGHEHERMERALTEVMGRIPELIAAVRNQTLEYYEGDDRDLLAAKYLLDNADASEQAVRQAFLDLTGDETLADAVRSIEVFRRAGLSSRVRDESRKHTTTLMEALPGIEHRSPAVAQEVRRRFAGYAPRKQKGRPRTEGFIERVLSTGEQDNSDLMSLNDAEEMLTLAFELLAGRSFTLFSLQWVGGTVVRELDRRLERARKELRVAIHVRNSRLRILAEYLNNSESIHRIPAAIPVILAVEEVLRNIGRAVREVHDALERRLPASTRSRNRRGGKEPRLGDGLGDASAIGAGRRFAADEVSFYRTMLTLWDSLYRANEQVKRRRASYNRALREYEARLRAVREPQRMKVLSPGEAGEGVRLVPREELLSAKDRMRLALRVSEVLAETEHGVRFIQRPAGGEDGGIGQLSSDGYKQIAAGVAIAIDQALSLGNSDLQLAIEASAAANVGSVEAGLSRETRIGWGVALVREVQEDVGRIVGRLVSSLAYYHGMYVSDAAVQHLVDRFGAPEPLLRRYTADGGPPGVHGVPAGTDHLAHQFLEVEPLPRAYHSMLERMQRRIDTP